MKHVITAVAFALMSSGLAQVSNHVPEEGLRYWSDFDGSVADQSVYHTSTSLFGAVPTVDRNGTMEGAMFFDGVDDHVKLFEVEGGVTFEDELTLVAWMKAEEFLGVQHPRLFHSSEGVGGGFDRWFFTWSPLSASSVVGFGVGNGQNSTVVVDSQNSVTSGEWHHVAAIFQNGLVKVMVDGVLESEAPLSFTSLSHIEAPVFLGSALGNSHFNGALDEVGIWDRALSVEEVLDLYLMSSGLTQLPDYVPSDGLVAWYPFNGNAQDESGYNNHGQSVGASLVADRFEAEASAYMFDGSSKVVLPEIEISGSFSSSFWLLADASSDQSDAVIDGSSGNFIRIVNEVDESWQLGSNSICSGNPFSQDGFALGDWVHGVVVFDGDSISFFLNGTFSNSLPDCSDFWKLQFIGYADNGNHGFDGIIDDVGFWNRGLSVEEIEVLSQWTPYGCTYAEACNYDFQAEIEDGTCDFTCLMMGCGDLAAINYDPYAYDGSDDDCLYIGCQDELALNYSVTANYPGECIYLESCPGDYSDDGVVDITDLLDFFQLYGGECELVDEIWSCGTPLGYQGYDYSTVQIGGQCWFSENLRSEDYRNGETISAGLSADEWGNSPTGAVASFQESVDSLEVYGRLYNWFAVVDSRGLCPSNWHVATDDEWKELEMSLGMSPEDTDGTYWRGSDQGTQLKSSNGWREDGDGTNTSGFSALPGGFRTAEGEFIDTYGNGYWWSSSASNSNAWSRHLDWVDSRVYRLQHSQNRGYSVRCLKDSE